MRLSKNSQRNFAQHMMHLLNNFSSPVYYLAETHSTNSHLSKLCSEQKVDEMTTLLTDYQTAGRGQRGNTWESTPKDNLLFSFVLYPDFLQARQQFYISQIVALSIKKTLDEYTDEVTIKWPNDIYWKDKKIAGILIENVLSGHHIDQSIAGIGLNINQKEFVGNAPNPISLFQILNKRLDRYEILANILVNVRHYYNLLQGGNYELISQHYLAALFRSNGMHPYKDIHGIFWAQIERIEEDGKLILQDENENKREYYFKEVEHILYLR